MPETRIPEALALLREKGWCKGRQRDPNGQHCIIGALIRVHNAEHLMTTEYRNDAVTVGNVLVAQYNERAGIASFNDDPATTFADVEFVMEKAILERGGAL